MEKRNELRRIFESIGNIPAEIFNSDDYFQDFELELKKRLPKEKVKLSGLNYNSLGDNKNTLDLRTIRCIFIKQNSPKDDGDSSVFEIFHRLNTGGINLTPQEIRVSLYHSDFMKMITEFNADKRWRKIIGKEAPDLRMEDIEILLRCAAMLNEGEKYAPSMTRFLNQFAQNMKKKPSVEKIALFKKVIEHFFDKCAHLNSKDFGIKNSSKFNISIFESVFYAVCYNGYQNETGNVLNISKEFIQALKEDNDFNAAVQNRTTNREQVRTRLKLAREILEKCHESNAY